MSPVPYISEPFTYPGGVIAAGVQVTVYYAATIVRAPLFHDEGVTRALNPVRTDDSGVARFWVEPGSYDLLANGVRSPVVVDGSGGPGGTAGTWLTLGSATGGPGTGVNPVYNDAGRSFEIMSVRATAVDVTGSPLIVDVNRNGSTIFVNQSNRPTLPVAAGRATVKVEEIDDVDLSDGDYLTVDVDQGNFFSLVVQVFIR